MRKILFTIAMLVAFVASTLAQDTVRISGTYNRTDFPYNSLGLMPGEYSHTENVNGFTVEGDVKLFKAGGLRGSVAYNFKRMLNQEVFPGYFDGMNVVDLYRDVNTHSGGGQLEYVIKDAFGVFGGLFYGRRKIHEDAPTQTIRNVRFGVIVPFAKKSPFFIKGYVDFEKPYGELPMGFINPDSRTLGVGGGFRF